MAVLHRGQALAAELGPHSKVPAHLVMHSACFVEAQGGRDSSQPVAESGSFVGTLERIVFSSF